MLRLIKLECSSFESFYMLVKASSLPKKEFGTKGGSTQVGIDLIHKY